MTPVSLFIIYSQFAVACICARWDSGGGQRGSLRIIRVLYRHFTLNPTVICTTTASSVFFCC